MAAGEIATRDGWSYTLTPEDRLWAARMIYGEGGDPKAVLWTMASRLALVRGGSFTRLLRAYSQPINPCWYRGTTATCSSGGAGCGPGSHYDVDAPCVSGVVNPCCRELLDRRAHILAMTEADLAPQLALVDRWMAGQSPNPVPRAVDFADPRVSQNCLDSGRCSRVIAKLPASAPASRQGWHLSTRASDSWPARYVSVGGASDGAIGGGLLALGLGGALAIGAWAWMRARRGLHGFDAPRGYIRKPKPQWGPGGERPGEEGVYTFSWEAARRQAHATAGREAAVARARLLDPHAAKKERLEAERCAAEKAFWDEVRGRKPAPAPKRDEDEEAHYTSARHHSTQWGRR
jgi:hypothetical protein